MAKTITVQAEARTESGKGAARKLRADGRIPAVIYGRGREASSLSVGAAEFDRALGIAEGDVRSTIFDLQVGKDTTRTLIREVQRHPSRSHIIHIDFLEIHAGETLTLEIGVHLVGRPKGVRNDGGTLDQTLHEIEIEVLPKDIPEHIELDVTDLEIGDSLHVSDIKLENVKFLTDLDATICSVIAPRTEEELEGEEEAEESVEPEVIGKAPEGEEEDEQSED